MDEPTGEIGEPTKDPPTGPAGQDRTHPPSEPDHERAKGPEDLPTWVLRADPDDPTLGAAPAEDPTSVWSGSPPVEAPRGRNGRSFGVRLAALVALVALAVGAGIGLTVALGGKGGSSAAGLSGRNLSALGVSAEQPNVAAIAAKVDPALVDITVTLDYGQGSAAGTGMILTPSGEVLTNNHVVDGATSIRVTVGGTGPTYSAEVVGVSPSADVALLQIEGASNLPTVTLGNSSTVTVGEPVVAIGNALGLSGPPTVTEGTVTALDRSITAGDPISGAEHLTGLIQADAPLSPGNSGGPLLDAAGSVIGMNTAAYASGPNGPASNVGFAIPINRALEVVHEIEAHDSAAGVLVGPRPLLGVEVADAGLGQFGGPFGGGFGTPAPGSGASGTTEGALVVGVLPGGPAASAGIVPGDVIVALDGESVGSASQLGTLVQAHKPGQHVSVGLVDASGATETVTVVLGTGPAA